MSEERKTVLAGGCFWGMEELFRELPGVVSTEVGYTGGENEFPTYENHPGHAEAIEIVYNVSELAYRDVLDFFFRIHNPTTPNRQGGDVGSSYRSAIFYASPQERMEAEQFIKLVDDSGRWTDPVVTKLEPLEQFYTAESYHQDYLQKNPGGYTCHMIYGESYLK